MINKTMQHATGTPTETPITNPKFIPPSILEVKREKQSSTQSPQQTPQHNTTRMQPQHQQSTSIFRRNNNPKVRIIIHIHKETRKGDNIRSVLASIDFLHPNGFEGWGCSVDSSEGCKIQKSNLASSVCSLINRFLVGIVPRQWSWSCLPEDHLLSWIRADFNFNWIICFFG